MASPESATPSTVKELGVDAITLKCMLHPSVTFGAGTEAEEVG